ncbi:MAG: asparagine synthase (glutamine-hydrolyzing) [Desulfomonile tiedjei]|nr:asparagine synthase (glutamine-hydrolyzing) [Desulfomonile tiedjei]
MCGIVGAFTFKHGGFQVTEKYITRMRDTMAHRGPDGASTWVSDDGRVGLGHRRLAIIDLSETANQPMSNKEGSLWLVFNGEIYNHAEIRSELESLGDHQWKTDHSDTEVIVHSFERWGIDCVEKFRGMFAIAVWDATKRELWLLRDRIGVKPLYYSVHDGRIVFASEIKALLQDPDQKTGVNEEALFHYLSFLTTPAPETLFEGIMKLPSGSWLRISEDGTVREKRYWDVWDRTEPMTGVSEEDIAHRLLDELRTSVKLRKVSDVPVGVFLSGGVDSVTNAYLFSEDATERVKTFTIGYEGVYKSYASEVDQARNVSETIGSDHHELLLTIDDLLEFLPEMVRLQDEPIADPVCVPIYYVCKLARDNGIIVAQVGEGSDELFCGYDQWKRMLTLERLNELPASSVLNRIGGMVLKLLGQDGRLPYEWFQRGAKGSPLYWGGFDVFFEHQKRQLLSERMLRKFRDLSSWDAIAPIHQRFKDKAWERSHANWMTYVDLNLRLPELLLMRVDKMSMAVALEARVPFLDHKFVELVMSIPSAIRVKNRQQKYILKKSVRGLIPDEIIDRKKQGFWLPIHEWYLDRLGTRTRDVMADFCRQTDFFAPEWCSRYLDGFVDTRGPVRAWSLLNLALWWKQYIR